MKIVHLITSYAGGAAQAAIRTHECLLESGEESKLISVERRVSSASNRDFKFQKTGMGKQLLSSAVTITQRSFIQRDHDLVTPISLDLLDWNDPDIVSADVLHLHAFYNLVSIKSFLQKFPNKRRVITLHDERFYTGGCHYSYECRLIPSGCQTCPQVRQLFRPLVAKQRRNVKSLMRQDSEVTFVCPSAWILHRAREAFPELPKENFVHIYNPIPKSNIATKKIATLNSELRFGFIAQNLENPIKNLDLALRAFDQLTELHPRKYSFTLLGESECDYTVNRPGVAQRVIRTLTELQIALGSIDVLIVPSKQDNLPSVLGEALINGVGLIGSDVGGIPEIIELFDQSLFKSGDETGLIQAMKNYQLSDRIKLEKRAEEVFGYHAIATKLNAVYSA